MRGLSPDLMLKAVSKKVPALGSQDLKILFPKKTSLTVSSPWTAIQAFPWRSDLPVSSGFRVSIITGKKRISKSAVIRNKARRRVKAAVQKVFPAEAPKAHDYILHVYPAALTENWDTLCTSLTNLLTSLKGKINSRKKTSTKNHAI